MLGPEILLWPFLENKMCHMPNTRVPVPVLVPSDALSTLFLLLCFVCMFPGIYGRYWKETGGQEEGTSQGVSPRSLPQQLVLLCGCRSQRTGHCSFGCCLPTPLPATCDLVFFYMPPVSGVIDASCTFFLIYGLSHLLFGFSVFHYMCK